MSERDVQQAEYDRRWAGNESGYGKPPLYAPGLLAFMDQWVSNAHLTSRKTLDLGCGRGFFSMHLAEHGCDVVGVDLSPAALRQARENLPQAEFHLHDVSAGLPFGDGEFDIVWCSEVLEHLFAPLEALRELTRVTRPGGLVLITVPAHTRFKNLVIAAMAFERHYDPTYPHIRFFTRKSIAELVTRAELSVLGVSMCGISQGWRDRLWPTNILLAAQA